MIRAHADTPRAAGSPDGGLAIDVLKGLSASQKTLPPRWFYDVRGSALFQQITDLPEYYLTACEAEILYDQRASIAGQMRGPFRLVELGAGDGRKTKILLRHFLETGLDFEFVPVDISESALAGLNDSLHREWPALRVEGLVAEYFDGLRWLAKRDDLPTLVLFLGSNIGNFEPGGDARFLKLLHDALKPGDTALVGFDLLKDPSVLIPAYDDAAGVTREFNLNLLDRINRELRANFKRSAFDHKAVFNAELGRMESWLISTRAQTVEVPGAGSSFKFTKGEGIHVESSFKYTLEQIATLAASAGFELQRTLLDKRGWFCDAILKRNEDT